jgi:hypothetical protein
LSAFVVDKAHIDTLTNAAIQLLVIKPSEAESLGQLLWDENQRSVNYKYGENEEVTEYERDVFDAPFHPIAILCVLRAYEYQAEETADWEETEAFTWCEKIRLAAELQLDPKDREMVHSRLEDRPVIAYKKHPIYTKTPWGVSDMRDVPLLVKEETST